MELSDWAKKWNIPTEALEDFKNIADTSTTLRLGESEAFVQDLVRLEASAKGSRLWRNNVGVAELGGRPVRFGLANDSCKINKVIKSSDLIGIKPTVITPEHVGKTLGVFLCREIKHSEWKYNPKNARERAQLAWIMLIQSLGGDASFATGPGTIK